MVARVLRRAAERARGAVARAALCSLALAAGCDDRARPEPPRASAPTPPSEGALERAARLLHERGEESVHGAAPTAGSAGAGATLVVFEDYSSPDCGRLAPLHRYVENLHADRIRLVVRQLPAPDRPESELAAEAALAAHAQGRFWDYHDALFANPHDHGRAALERYASAIGLDVPAFMQALDRGTFAPDVAADRELGEHIGIRAVPATFLDGRPVEPPWGVSELAQLAALAR